MYTDATGCYPLQTAFEFFDKWLNGDGEEENYSKDSRIVKLIKKSKKMKAYIQLAIANFEAGQSVTTGYGEFTREEDGDELYLSTQHFDYTITIVKEFRTVGFFRPREMMCYRATITVHDTYNFDSLREWEGFGNVMNNLAYIYHVFGGGNDFEWSATYTYSTKWTDVS